MAPHSPTLNAFTTNILNAALMVVSAGLAFVVPFELFVYAYAIRARVRKTVSSGTPQKIISTSPLFTE
jgi:hypothetical protein